MHFYSASHGISQTKALLVLSAPGEMYGLRRDRDEDRRREGTEGIEERREGERQFQREEPIDVKEMVWSIVVLTRRIKRAWRFYERRGRREEAEVWSQRYLGAEPS